MGYAGWIPTINGRLSFSLIGNSSYPTKTLSASSQHTGIQYVVARQRRDLNDYLFPKLTTRVFGVSGKFDFFVVARSKLFANHYNSLLLGKIYVLRTDGFYGKKSDDIANSYLKRSAAGLEDEKKQYLNLHQELTGACLFEADFVLRRNGFFTLWEITSKDNSIERNSQPLFNSAASSLNSYLANQIYFFFRDITHQHQHHGPDSDTLIGIHENKDGSLDWTREVIFALHSYVIRQRRVKSSEEQTRLLGILAYIKSFKKIVEQRAKEIEVAGFSLPPFDEDLTKSSIEAAKAYLDAQATRRKTSFEHDRTVFLWVVAVVGTFLSILLGMAEKTAPSDPRFVNLANLLKANPWALFVPFVLVLAWGIAMRVWVGLPEQRRDLFRLALYNRWIAAAISLGFALLFVWLAYYVYP